MSELSDVLKQAISTEIDKGVKSRGVNVSLKKWTKERENEFSSLKIEELLKSHYFLGRHAQYLYPAHLDDIIELWYRRKTEGVYVYAGCEGIGSGKTYKLGIISALLSYEILTRVDFFDYFILSPISKIAIVVTSRDASKAKNVTFQQLMPFFNTPFINDYFKPQVDFDSVEKTKRLPSMLRFPRSFSVFPGTGNEAAALGWDVYGALLDEVNYMTLVTESKRVKTGKVYDAAELAYDAAISRMKSRFTIRDKVHGLILCTSNTRYKGDFLERKAEEAQTDKTIMFVRRATWKAHPVEKVSKETFRFDVGRLQVLKEGEVANGRVEEVPVTWVSDFIKNPVDAWRRLGDTPIPSLMPYFTQTSLIDLAIDERKNPFNELQNKFDDQFVCKDDFPRFVHVDLGRTSDAACMAMCYAKGVRPIDLIEERSIDLGLDIEVDFVVRLDPVVLQMAIDFKVMRELLYELRRRGFNIVLTTYDRFQSMDSIDRLREAGFVVENLSIDRTSSALVLSSEARGWVEKRSTGKKYTAAMDALKEQISFQGVHIPLHYVDPVTRLTRFELEARSAERIVGNDGAVKVVPAVGETDDVLQVIAGAVFNCVSNVRPESGRVSLDQEVPKRVKDAYQKMDQVLGFGSVGDDDDDFIEIEKSLGDTPW